MTILSHLHPGLLMSLCSDCGSQPAPPVTDYTSCQLAAVSLNMTPRPPPPKLALGITLPIWEAPHRSVIRNLRSHMRQLNKRSLEENLKSFAVSYGKSATDDT